jgi:hypothetical protein
MKHLQFETMIFDQGSLAPEEHEGLKSHLDECRSCRRLDAQWRRIEDLLVDASRVEAPPGFTSRFMTRLRESRRRHQTRLFLATMAFTLGGLIVAGVFLGLEIISKGPTYITWMLKTASQLSWVGDLFALVIDLTLLFLESLVSQLPILTLVGISALISLLSITWIASFYQLGFRYQSLRRE